MRVKGVKEKGFSKDGQAVRTGYSFWEFNNDCTGKA